MNLKKEGDQKRKYNILIIGCGGQGAMADVPGSGNEHKIISFTSAFSKHENTNNIIFYDEDIKKQAEAARIWNGVDIWDIESTMKYVDIVIIATPDDSHFYYLKKVAEYKPKLVIAEKPLCDDLNQAREIVELYKEKNIPLLVNYTRRFIPYYDKLKQWGKPKYGECRFNRGWLHTGTHAIDFFEMWRLDDYKLIEVESDERVWDLKFYFDGKMFGEKRIGNAPVWQYYDDSMIHVANNAYNFLEGKEDIKCTGEDALNALEICYNLM